MTYIPTHTPSRMKKEMVSKVNTVAGEFRKVSDLQIVETTKRTIRENVTISQQLSKMSEKTMALLRENEALRMKETELSRRVELLENGSREVTRKNVSNQKVCVHNNDCVTVAMCVCACTREKYCFSLPGDVATAGESYGTREGARKLEAHSSSLRNTRERGPAGHGTCYHFHH